MRDVEKETRDRLIDAARTHLIVLAGRQTGLTEALERLSQQAHGNADRLRGAAEQLRRRFAGAEAISLLEAAAEHARRSHQAGTAGPPRATGQHGPETAAPAAWLGGHTAHRVDRVERVGGVAPRREVVEERRMYDNPQL